MKRSFTPRPARQWTADELPGVRVPFERVEPAPRAIVTIVKSKPTRDETYRRLVAALPCSHCGIEGHSQAAHGPTLGGAIKSDDTASFPLCADRPGVKGCHPLFDQYQLFDAPTRVRMSAVWGERARGEIEGRPAWASPNNPTYRRSRKAG